MEVDTKRNKESCRLLILKGEHGVEDTNLEFQILAIVGAAASPVGSHHLAQALADRGITVSAPTAGRFLLVLEKEGSLEQIKRRGRIITRNGSLRLEELRSEREQSETAKKLLARLNQPDVSILLEQVETRLALEKAGAGLAATRASDQEIRMIATYAELLDEVLEDSPHRHSLFHQAMIGRQFHEAVADASKNQILATTLRLINKDLALRDILVRLRKMDGYVFGGNHRSISEAIKNHDPDAAEKAMADHINEIVVNVRRFLELNPDLQKLTERE